MSGRLMSHFSTAPRTRWLPALYARASAWSPQRLRELQSRCLNSTGVAGSACIAAEAEARSTQSLMSQVSEYRALVLDSSYRPIDVVNWQKAICLDLFDKVDVLEYYDFSIRSAFAQHLLPAVLRVRVYVARKKNAQSRVQLSRRAIMVRDRYTCQYCGSHSNLTIDHVVPVSKQGLWAWENLVTACGRCNGKKGNKSLQQLKWKLRKQPVEPSPYELGLLLGVDYDVSRPPKEWSNYLFELQKKRPINELEESELGLAAITDFTS